MKKFFVSMGAALTAVLALTNCNKEEMYSPDDYEGNVPFCITADAPQSKTVNDGGFGTDWAAGDGINLFYAWYYQYYQTVTDKKLQHRMHAELFGHALKMDLACYDDPKFYNDYVWAMDESKGRAVQVLDDTARIINYLITLSTLITLMMQVDIIVGLILLIGCALNASMWGLGNKIAFKKNERVKPFHRKNTLHR